jgi:drug/metabolite transporter (DMT)-like permease
MEINNPFATIFFVFGLISLFFALYLGKIRGGFFAHPSYFFYLSVSLIYLFITPYYFFYYGEKDIHLSNISQYYDDGFWYNTLSIYAFVIGYWLIPQKPTTKQPVFFEFVLII